MKKINIAFMLFLAAVMVFTACQPDEHELGPIPDKSQIQYEITQDLVTDPGGNTVILKNSTPGTITYWDYSSGHSTKATETVHFAFKGDYVIKLSVLTDGGMVEFEPKTITVTENNLNYVNDPLWTLLSGGVGKEKTWLMDANANRESKFFASPIFFAGMDNAYGTIADDGQSLVWSKVCQVPNGANCWTYEPNYKNDTWAADAVDYGVMTFSLNGGAFLTTDHKGVSGVNKESGSYFLDVNTKVLTTTNATPLTVSYGPTDAATVNSMRVLSLTKTTMQLAFKNKSKDEYFIINYYAQE